MSNKIPVGATIGGAYRFAFGRFFGVLGVVWLPSALTIAAIWFLLRDVTPPSANPADAKEAFDNFQLFYASVMGPFYILQLVFWVAGTMIEVGLTKLALGGRAPIAYFDLGPSFWRLFGANLILFVAVMVLIVPFVLVVIALGGIAGAMTHAAGGDGGVDPSAIPWVVLGAIAVGVAAFIGFYYAYLRAWFLLAPVVVAEKHIDLRPGWRLARGNVLRIFVILLAVTIPPLLLLVVAEIIAFATVLSYRWTTFPDAAFFAERWPVFAGAVAVAALGWLLATAAAMGARAVAYRALVPAAEPAAQD
jgi:hypothetical protein